MTSDECGLVLLSESESARFGVRIGRFTPVDPDGVRALCGKDLAPYDVVIIRQPASWADRWSDLLRFDDHVALHADTLVYWSWKDDGAGLPTVSGLIHHHSDATGVDEMVREVFAGYQNHYASNPLFDRGTALEGYVEWAVQTCEQSIGYLTVVDDEGPIGFSIVDWTARPPDVRLAGLCARARGAGRYRDLVLAMMESARARGHVEIRISTQVQNIAVQRTWSALGWRPTGAFDTTHLVRSQLLSDSYPPGADR